MVALQREPNNPYDKNAVKVNNVNGDQLGLVKKELAAALAGIMDNKLAIVEGVVPYGAKNTFTMPVQMSFWGREENKEVVLDQLKRHRFKLAPHLKVKCLLCRKGLQLEHLAECPLEEERDSSSGKKPDQEWISSSKINALMHALIKLRRDNPAAKCLVVSQFTTFLSLIENPLKESGFAFTGLDGSVAQKKRVEAIQCFQSNQAGSPTIMLLSLKAGGVGLNLTAASRMFLMDPAYNPAAEDQCFDRYHRLGQKHNVAIAQFIVKDSVEENILNIQNKKRELAAGAFATKKPSASEVKQNKINEIKALIDL